MKTAIQIIPILLLALSCKAQTINIEDQTGEDIPGAYYKDANDLLNPFVGTYIYTNGSTSLKIVLQKKIMSTSGYDTRDLLIGEYQYIENGIEKANTLSQLSANNPDQRNHSISGNFIFSNGAYWCGDCSPGERRFMGGITEAATGNYAQLIISRTTVGNQQAIKINIWWHSRAHREGDPPLLQPSFTGGDYFLIKQP